MSKEAFEKLLYLSSVQLSQLNAKRIPIDFTSGALINYQGIRLLLSVSHATGNNEKWSIQVKFIQGKGTEHYQLGAMNFLAKTTLSNPIFNDIDFSYVVIPDSIIGYRQEITPPDTIKTEIAITVHQTNLSDLPKLNENYGFCGMVMPTHEEHFGQFYVGGELKIYSGLSYLRTEDDYYVFKLPFEHPGHEYFKGCSGAPVLSEAGAVVGLVCKGCKKNNEIYAISLKTYKFAIDILVGNVG